MKASGVGRLLKRSIVEQKIVTGSYTKKDGLTKQDSSVKFQDVPLDLENSFKGRGNILNEIIEEERTDAGMSMTTNRKNNMHKSSDMSYSIANMKSLNQ